MADPVAALLRRSLGHLESEVPASYGHLVATMGPMVIDLDVDGERFGVHGGPRILVVDGPSPVATARVATTRDTIVAVLDAELTLHLAVETGRVDVRGRLDDVVRAHDALLAYAHAAVRAPSVPALVAQLRGTGPSGRR